LLLFDRAQDFMKLTTQPPDMDIIAKRRGLTSGSTQSGVRLYNERLVLSLIRSHGALPKAEIARLTRLSPQTVSVIVRQLEADDLLLKGESLKGKVGQPLQPFSLNPEGAFSIGLKVGRRSGDLVLMGLDGVARKTVHQPYRFPTPTAFIDFARNGIFELMQSLPEVLRDRISGLGIARPFDIWKWEEEAGASHDVLESWKHFDVRAELAKSCPWPVVDCNDASAACAAELLLGQGRRFRDFAYFYVGYFIGGGVVLNGHLYDGTTGNAGAFASMPVATPAGGQEQLIRSSSLYMLERDLRKNGLDESMLWKSADDWRAAGDTLSNWIDRAAHGLTQSAVSVASVIEPAAIIIDGAMPPAVRHALVNAVRKNVAAFNREGLNSFEIIEGSIGVNARAMGAASLPLFANFMVDQDILFKVA
jgi:predicted NBD/HSP70 family sugar kinase